MSRSRRSHPEDAIQIAVAEHLRVRCSPGVVWWHTPNGFKLGGRRSKSGFPIQATKFKRFGVRAGVSDILAFHDSKLFALELKAPGNRPTGEQLQFLADVEATGGFTAVCDSIERALACLEAWGLLRGVAA